MMATGDDIRERESRHVLQTYKRQPVAFVLGVGSRLGKRSNCIVDIRAGLKQGLHRFCLTCPNTEEQRRPPRGRALVYLCPEFE